MECAWAADTTSGRAAWICEWIMKAAALSGQLPSTTSPSVVHQQNVPDPDLLEVHAERVDPEVVVELGVARGDVPGRTLVEPEVPEQPEGRGEALFAVPPLLFDAAELREARAVCGQTPLRTAYELCTAQSNRIASWTSR